ncbi:MAG: hypothetical protein IH912_11585, partial [Proteobacteria bacterium]|nr:hypothetical protein [Pseudomonadota bacterium]
MTASLPELSTITDWQTVGNLHVEPAFYDFVTEELLPAIKFDAGEFWAGLENINDELAPLNRNLLRVRAGPSCSGRSMTGPAKDEAA